MRKECYDFLLLYIFQRLEGPGGGERSKFIILVFLFFSSVLTTWMVSVNDYMLDNSYNVKFLINTHKPTQV